MEIVRIFAYFPAGFVKYKFLDIQSIARELGEPMVARTAKMVRLVPSMWTLLMSPTLPNKHV